jgi:hypothetical protein
MRGTDGSVILKGGGDGCMLRAGVKLCASDAGVIVLRYYHVYDMVEIY